MIRIIRNKLKRRHKGMALIFTLLGVVILSMLAGGLLYVASAGNLASMSFKSETQANFAAQAGVQTALNWYRTYYGCGTTSCYLDSTAGITATAAYSSAQPPQYSSAAVTLGGNSANFPTSSVKTSFDAMRSGNITMGNTTGSYAVTATLLSHDRNADILGNAIISERWQVISTGTIIGALGNSTVQLTATVERIFIPQFKDAIRGRCQVNLGGNINTDSFYSSAGVYGGANLYTGADAQANVGSNTYIQEKGKAGTINGNAYYGTPTATCPCPGGDCEVFTSSSTVAGQIVQAPGVSFVALPAFSTANNTVEFCGNPALSGANTILYPNTGAGSSASPTAVSPTGWGGGGHYGSCSPGGGNPDVYLCLPNSTTPVSYYFNRFNIGSNTNVKMVQADGTGKCSSASPTLCGISNPCAPAIMNVNEAFTFNGSGGLFGSSASSTLTINYSGTSDIDMKGCSELTGTIYAPNATLALKGGATIYGAVQALNVTDTGDVNVHYDLSLQTKAGQLTPFRLINQTRNVF